VIENRCIQLFLGGEVTKDHRFGNAGGLGNFLGSGAAKTTLGKQVHGTLEDLHAPFVAGHARHDRIGNQVTGGTDLFAQSVLLRFDLENRSKYLLTTGPVKLSSSLYPVAASLDSKRATDFDGSLSLPVSLCCFD
jgi:hypothetical protein